MNLKFEIKDHMKRNPPTAISTYKKPAVTSSSCPFCKNYPMKFINLKGKRFLVCADPKCNNYLSLPKKGRLTLLKSHCSLCGFNIFKVLLRKQNRSYNYYLCPRCWNEGLNRKDGSGFCSNCKEYHIINGKCVRK
jgi:hypothetical protein